MTLFVLRVLSPIGRASTSATRPYSFVQVNIFRSEFVASLAMRLRTFFGSMSIAGLFDRFSVVVMFLLTQCLFKRPSITKSIRNCSRRYSALFRKL